MNDLTKMLNVRHEFHDSLTHFEIRDNESFWDWSYLNHLEGWGGVHMLSFESGEILQSLDPLAAKRFGLR